MKLKVLELYAGTRSIGKAFEKKGHELFSVEWDRDFEDIDLYDDVNNLTAERVIELMGGRPDIIWASPDCTTYSVMAISHHRERESDGNLRAKTEYAQFCDKTNAYVLNLIKELNPKYWFIENPVGGMRKMSFMQDLPRYTVTYCFAKDTKIVTKQGVKEIGELSGQTVSLLTSKGYVEASIRCYGQSQLMKLTLSRSGKIKEVFVTPNHKWILKNGKIVETQDLTKSQRLMYCPPVKPMAGLKLIPEFVARGFAFGDGYVLSNDPSKKGFVMFCFDKQEMMGYFDGICGEPYRHNAKKYGDNVLMLYGYPREWKTELPGPDWSDDEKYSWIAGYIAADGSTSNNQISCSSSRLDVIECIRDRSREIGIDTYSPVVYFRKGYGNVPTPLYQVTFMRKDVPMDMILRTKHRNNLHETKHQPRCWGVVSVEMTDRIENVYCADVPEVHNFSLDDGLLTHNCQYGETRQKPTDIWTNHPDPEFKPPCKRGSPCHERAPRGSKCGTQKIQGAKNRARIPEQLCDHIVEICER